MLDAIKGRGMLIAIVGAFLLLLWVVLRRVTAQNTAQQEGAPVQNVAPSATSIMDGLAMSQIGEIKQRQEQAALEAAWLTSLQNLNAANEQQGEMEANVIRTAQDTLAATLGTGPITPTQQSGTETPPTPAPTGGGSGRATPAATDSGRATPVYTPDGNYGASGGTIGKGRSR